VSHTLLLADDSATIQRVIELTFSGEDVNVLTVGDGEQAIARIPTDHPDIILADIGMPKRNGYDVAAFVKGHPDLKHIPVLLLAGAFEPVDQQRAEQVGCDGVLVKPFEPQHVIARVRELLDGVKGTAARATPDIARPAERLAPSRTLEFPRREEPRALPAPDAAPPEPPVTADFDLGPAKMPEPLEKVAQPLGADESLDDYFDRLDAAFATLDSAPPASSQPHTMPPIEERDVPTLDDLLGSDFTAPPAPIDLPLNIVAPPPVEPPDVTPTRAPPVADSIPAVGATRASPLPADQPARSLVADAFAALLAVEQGEPGATAVRLMTGPSEPVITDALVDEVTTRVIARLAPELVRQVVAEVVSEVAERLVREEIDRIRNKM
jgi:CheY-like chemotaxis protein